VDPGLQNPLVGQWPFTKYFFPILNGISNSGHSYLVFQEARVNVTGIIL